MRARARVCACVRERRSPLSNCDQLRHKYKSWTSHEKHDGGYDGIPRAKSHNPGPETMEAQLSLTTVP